MTISGYVTGDICGSNHGRFSQGITNEEIHHSWTFIGVVMFWGISHGFDNVFFFSGDDGFKTIEKYLLLGISYAIQNGAP